MNMFMILSICLPLFIALHITEEFVYPGGFMKWYQRYKPAIEASIRPGFLIKVNVILVLLCVVPFIYGLTPQGVAWWLCIASVIAVNTWFHVKGTIVPKSYSPGLITSLILYLPLAVYGNWFFISSNLASWQTAVVSFLPGVVYHIYSSLNHKRRAKKFQNNNHGE